MKKSEKDFWMRNLRKLIFRSLLWQPSGKCEVYWLLWKVPSALHAVFVQLEVRIDENNFSPILISNFSQLCGKSKTSTRHPSTWLELHDEKSFAWLKIILSYFLHFKYFFDNFFSSCSFLRFHFLCDWISFIWKAIKI